MRRILDLLKTHFFTGMLILIPISVSVWILAALGGALWQLKDLLPEAWNPATYFENSMLGTLINVALTVGATIIGAIGISAIGWASRLFLGRKLIELIEHIIQRIPVVRSIYSALDQLLRTIASDGGRQFNRVVHVEYPRKGMWTLAFVTSSSRIEAVPEKCLNLFVPTTPNPTSGFYLIVPESEVRDAHMTVEEAFKTILSLGIAHGPTRQ